MMAAACFSFNVSPQPDLHSALSRTELWTRRRPDLHSFGIHPGTLVIYDLDLSPDSLGLYAFPFLDDGHNVFDLASRTMCRVDRVRVSMSLFTSELLRSAPASDCFFHYPLRPPSTSSLGFPILLGASLGLLPDQWSGSTGSYTIPDDVSPPTSPAPAAARIPRRHPEPYGAGDCHGGVNLGRADDLACYSPPRPPRSDNRGASTISSVDAGDPNPRRAPTHGI